MKMKKKIVLVSTKINQFSGTDERLDNVDRAEDQIALQMNKIIDHFKNDDPIGLPMFPLPDPFDVPDVKQSMSFGTLQMSNVKLHGISKFRLKFISTEVREMEAKCGIQFDALTLIGNYTIRSMITRNQGRNCDGSINNYTEINIFLNYLSFSLSLSGPFTITLNNVLVFGNASLGVERDGKIRTENITIDIKFSDMTMDFRNLGLLAKFFQSLANSASNMVK
jgi:hypothetical protein